MNYLLTILLTTITTLAFNHFSPPQIWDDVRSFGSTNFPTSLDTLTNPSGTDSVATVSHSAQHANANDSIEAVEAKLGIGASTAVTDSIFAGNGTGSSLFTTYATSTRFYASNFWATGSSTLQNFTFNLATGTAATTTNFFATNASSTALFGANLSTCNGASQSLQWSGGYFGCNTLSVSGISSVSLSTTTATGYRAKTVSVTSGQNVMWWGSCQNSSLSSATDLVFRYRTSLSSASTTVMTLSAGINIGHISGFGLFTATTTYNVTVDILSSVNCDNGIELMTLVTS